MAEEAGKTADGTQAGATAAAGAKAAAGTPPDKTEVATPDKTAGVPPDKTAAPKPDEAKQGRWQAWRAALRFAAPAGEAAAKTEPAFAVLPEPKPSDAPADTDAPLRKAAGSLFGSLDADERLRQEAERNERMLWAGAVAATLIYASLITGQMVAGFAAPIPLDQQQQQKERRGQDGPPDSISVELVPEPDKNAKTKRWQDGADVPAPRPAEQMPQPPQPPQTAALEQPQVNETETPEPEKEKEQKEAEEEKSGDPMLLDVESLAEAAAADFTRQVDRAFSKKPQKRQEERQQVYSAGAMKVRGQGASGKSDAFSRSVIDALMKTRPGPFAIWGRVLVSFEIAPSGTLNYVRVLDSSGNSALDQAAVNAIHKARFKAPPAGLSREERTYIIDYIFG